MSRAFAVVLIVSGLLKVLLCVNFADLPPRLTWMLAEAVAADPGLGPAIVVRNRLRAGGLVPALAPDQLPGVPPEARQP